MPTDHLEHLRERSPTHYRCITCKHFGLCAPDCTLAPWNFEPATYPATPFVYLLRQRRWAGSPVHPKDTRFMNIERQRYREI